MWGMGIQQYGGSQAFPPSGGSLDKKNAFFPWCILDVVRKAWTLGVVDAAWGRVA